MVKARVVFCLIKGIKCNFGECFQCYKTCTRESADSVRKKSLKGALRVMFDEADNNLIWDLWCINSWISVSADNKVHKKESLWASWWGHRMCEEYVLIWFSVSGGIQLRSTSLWLEVPVSTFGAGRLLYKHKHRIFFFANDTNSTSCSSCFGLKLQRV